MPREVGDTHVPPPPPYSPSYGATGEGPPGYEPHQADVSAVVDSSGISIFICSLVKW